jgi:hypothetical protein
MAPTRCISAICPAGPPKLSQPIRAHTRIGLANEGRAGVSTTTAPWHRGVSRYFDLTASLTKAGDAPGLADPQ